MRYCYFTFFFFLFIFNLFSLEVVITDVDGSTKELYFDEDEDAIIISKTLYKIESISGLEQFKSLRYLSIEFSDLRFLDIESFPILYSVETLELSFITIDDFSLIRKFPNLIAFSCNETHEAPNDVIIDFFENPKIEYFEFDPYSLNSLPVLLNIPESLKYCYFNIYELNNVDVDELKRWYDSDIQFILEGEIKDKVLNELTATFDNSDLVEPLWIKYLGR